jgi:hypothetical protein
MTVRASVSRVRHDDGLSATAMIRARCASSDIPIMRLKPSGPLDRRSGTPSASAYVGLGAPKPGEGGAGEATGRYRSPGRRDTRPTFSTPATFKASITVIVCWTVTAPSARR